MRTRKATVIAASVGVAVAAATGVTYASSALESAPRSASIVQDAAPVAPRGGNGTGTEAGSNAATAPADAGSKESWSGKKSEGRGENRGDNHWGNRGDGHEDGQVMINERTYAAEPGSCIAVVNAGNGQIAADSFNIRNDSDKTVEFFAGITCDNGAPVATVGPHSSTSAVEGDNAGSLLVGSFRVF
ncbi:hypothetical protein PV726_06745 [Streptomyces europaeiscabiei]|uniref:hypothetical protein n=1 Tax=Streptomyces europaeiscabiei TaxID=146819 RepID=UPI0029BC6ACE|nr:hypothetical protein [Streptomyces europaeiscabiei]MDX3690041.1 hypothetical protein [Streptomyces europaeiscabiei]